MSKAGLDWGGGDRRVKVTNKIIIIKEYTYVSIELMGVKCYCLVSKAYAIIYLGSHDSGPPWDIVGDMAG